MVSYNQAGYKGLKRSTRAKEAYEGGEMPATKWTKEALLKGIAEAFGDEVAEKAQKLSKLELVNVFLDTSSWHHVGAFATPVWFYKIAEDRTAEEASRIVDQLIEQKTEQKAEKKAEKKEEKKAEKKEEKKAVFLKIIADRNISKYRRWTNWKKFTYFCIAKEGDKFAEIIADDSQALESKIKIDGKHVLNTVKLDSRRQFTDGIKELLNIEKIGNISKKIDEFLKK